MLRGYAIVLFTLSIIDNVCSNTCGHDNCETAIDIPLITKLNAPLKAELDITSLTLQLKELIEKHVNQSVSIAVNDLVENILDKTVQTAVDKLQTSNDNTLSTFRQKIEDELEVKIKKNNEYLMKKQSISATEIHSLTKLVNKLDQEMTQIKSEVETATEKVAVTSCAPNSITYNSGEIIKFSDVKLSNGIRNIDKFKSSGIFTCEKQGLYLVGAYIMSYSYGAQFQIVRNGNMVSQVHFRPDSIPKDVISAHTGTGIIAVQLNVKDTLNVKAGYGNMYVYGSGYSCLTVIKVK